MNHSNSESRLDAVGTKLLIIGSKLERVMASMERNASPRAKSPQCTTPRYTNRSLEAVDASPNPMQNQVSSLEGKTIKAGGEGNKPPQNGLQRSGNKYDQAWDNYEGRLNAKAFSGTEYIETIASDFDMVFVFANPEFVKCFKEGDSGSGGIEKEAVGGEAKIIKNCRQGRIQKLRAEEEKLEKQFKEKLLERAKRMRSEVRHAPQQGTTFECKETWLQEKVDKAEDSAKSIIRQSIGRMESSHHPTYYLRCKNCKKVCDYAHRRILDHSVCHHEAAECKGEMEEVHQWCTDCKVKVNVAAETCGHCEGQNFEDKVGPFIHTMQDLDIPGHFPLCCKELIKSFFLDPRQAEEVQFPSEIMDLNDARRAVLDIFLSFFRAQEEESYYTYLFKSVDFDEIFLCVKMSDKSAKNHAEESLYPLMMDKNKLERPLHEGGLNIAYGGQNDKVATHALFESIRKKARTWYNKNFKEEKYGRELNPSNNGGRIAYRQNPICENLLSKHHIECQPGWGQDHRGEAAEGAKYLGETKSFLRKLDRIRLLYDKLTDHINVQDLQSYGLLIDFFPLHTRLALSSLKKDWARIGLFTKSYLQPMHKIQGYFGSSVAMYFAFGELMLRYTLVVILVTIVFTIVELGTEVGAGFTHGSFLRALGGKAGYGNNVLRIAYSLFLIVFCQVFDIKMKRNYFTQCSVWGIDQSMFTTIKNEQNPDFFQYATLTRSDLNERQLELTVTFKERMQGQLISNIGTGLYVALTFGCSVSILAFQAECYRNTEMRDWSTKMSYVLFITIQILLLIWSYLGRWLVALERWRDRLMHNDAMAYKNFAVQIVTTFCSFYYIAFFMKPLGDMSFSQYGQYTKDGQLVVSVTPWEYLTYQMIIVFGCYMLYSVKDLLQPWFRLRRSTHTEMKRLKHQGEKDWKYSFIEAQSKMTEYDGDLANDDYMQILLPWGFVFFFGAALPISSIICWVYTSLQLRVDAWKLCYAMRRPFPTQVKPDSWAWKDIISVFLQIAIITNIGLIVFTMRPIADLKASNKVAIFFIMISASYLSKGIFSSMFPEVPHLVELARRRHIYQREVALRILHRSSKNQTEEKFADQYLKLSADKRIRFLRSTVGRLRPEDYVSSTTHGHLANGELVDKVYEPTDLDWV